jgi:dihydrofolate reductase
LASATQQREPEHCQDGRTLGASGEPTTLPLGSDRPAQGRTRFAHSLVATGLIDEYRLVVHPAVLGGGDRLFDTPLIIKPTSTTAFSRGAAAHVFAAHA